LQQASLYLLASLALQAQQLLKWARLLDDLSSQSYRGSRNGYVGLLPAVDGAIPGFRQLGLKLVRKEDPQRSKCSDESAKLSVLFADHISHGHRSARQLSVQHLRQSDLSGGAGIEYRPARVTAS
jgi:hypothetical protein